ncbi:hypothetical protein N7488_005767 [Penicillium malachiteum]|nr:hypothetical protein N7488_005767 [Penicillium malachiteum]
MDPVADRAFPSVGDQHRGGPATIGMPNAPGAMMANPFEEPQRRMNEYTAQQVATLQARLDKKLGPEFISSRPGAGGAKVHYLSADKCISLANEVFGFNGWSSSIQKIDIDFIEENQNTGKINLGLSVIVRVTWDVDELHRHRDHAPVKKEVPPPKPITEDDDLPPQRPVEPTKSSNPEISANFEVDGEFGSDVFDEADFVVSATGGNPDEITIEPEPRRQQPPTPMNRPIPPRGPPTGRFDPSAVTPSKPERWNAGNQAAARQSLPPNLRPNPNAMPDSRRPMPGPGQVNNMPNTRPGAPPQARPPVDTNMQNTNAPAYIKREGAPTFNNDNNQPPAGSQSVGFFSARAADSLRDNPNAVPLPGSQFDPHAESPSIRKTAGVDHTKSVPISRPMLSAPSPAPNNSRDYVNPATDLQRRVGAPGTPGGGVGSPLSRGPSTSSYRPLTRPNIDTRNAPNPAAMNRGSVPPQNNLNGKRPPLNDVTNATTSAGANPVPAAMGQNDPKRPRVSDVAPGPPQPPNPPQQ